ncbi:MAG: aspartate--ammonia ligase, partial [Bacteroidales bacterium]|nr:aspartate--ammonia ligase [Bacteroidales bacterium]
MSLYLPPKYRNLLGSVEQTEKAIKAVKDMFQDNLSAQLALLRVTAPMTVLSGTGINDDLNGIERPVHFPVRSLDEQQAEVVHSLAKWKRLKLAELGITPGRGIYTDMNALRPDEDLDNLHSIYVDQWDWEKVIRDEDRNLDFLKRTVRRIYEAVKVTENKLYVEFPQLVPALPDEIFFIHAEQLLQQYPNLSPKERENAIVREHKAVFIIGIGGKLSDGSIHDGRA